MARKIETADFESYERVRTTPPVSREENLANLYLALVLGRWKLIAFVTVVAIVSAFVYSKFIATKWYQASAVIVPVPEGAVENRVEGSGSLGALGGGGMSTFLMTSGIDLQAQQYLTILQSFAFNTQVAMHHKLADNLLSGDTEEKPKTERQLRMKLYDALKGRFSVDYSIRAQDLTVHFLDRDPIVAQQILEYYLDDLRELQRQEAIRDTTAAIATLEKEAKDTGDPLLSGQLYSMVARQVERQKLAEVEADFAFSVLEPPISPDRPYWPRARINCFLALIFTPLIMSAGIVVLSFFFDSRRRAGNRSRSLRPLPLGESESLD